MSEIILDTETTGLSVKDGHRILEIACVETENLIPTKRVFYKLINPEKEISADASRIHGYTYEILKNKEKFADIAKEFKDFIADKKLIIHNAPFDISFINSELTRLNLEKINIKKNVIDSLEIARSKFPGSSNSLDNLCKKFNIDLSKRTKHNALLDCELLRQVYRLLFAPEGTFTERLQEVREVFGSKPLANEILNFLKNNSQRSIVHPGSNNS